MAIYGNEIFRVFSLYKRFHDLHKTITSRSPKCLETKKPRECGA
ncbi:uncharacterized protein METZ01_LOCUS388561 [marine metagenome]|uniref:Uncharacterized protein n=1 Tax=marine metagenome TaxID=408172 RepID=A0A382UNP5_9ZZZZ